MTARVDVTSKLGKVRLLAAVDLIQRTGATRYEVGFDADETNVWRAQAYYRGAREWGEPRPDPVTATESLLENLVDGGGCTRCHRPSGILLDGDDLDAVHRGAMICWFTRMGAKYIAGCQ